MQRKYKCINHLTPSQQIDLVIIDLKGVIPPEGEAEFEKIFAEYQIKKKEEEEREDRESEWRKEQYEKEQEYLKKLKKMEES